MKSSRKISWEQSEKRYGGKTSQFGRRRRNNHPAAADFPEKRANKMEEKGASSLSLFIGATRLRRREGRKEEIVGQHNSACFPTIFYSFRKSVRLHSWDRWRRRELDFFFLLKSGKSPWVSVRPPRKNALRDRKLEAAHKENLSVGSSRKKPRATEQSGASHDGWRNKNFFWVQSFEAKPVSFFPFGHCYTFWGGKKRL